MKTRLIYLLPVLVAFVLSCNSNKSENPSPYPSGTFSGVFKRVHQHGLVIDTVKANITLSLIVGEGFRVTGDTSTVHAGSNGHYGFKTSADSVAFLDATYPASGTPTKVHLNGTYKYTYDGTNFQMLSNKSDTLSLQYILKKD